MASTTTNPNASEIFNSTLARLQNAGYRLDRDEDLLYPKGRGALAYRPYYPGFRECGFEVFECGPYKRRVRIFAHVLSAVCIGLPPGESAPDVEYIEILPDRFLMGAQSDEEGFQDERPQHYVRFQRPFLIARTPVTQRVWAGWYRFVSHYFPNAIEGLSERPAHFQDRDEDDSTDHVGTRPVESVSWIDAVRMFRLVGLRLPSEAQWEYAARGGSPNRYCYGNDPSQLGDYGWYYENSGSRTHSVAQKLPNAFGLFDVHGNVWEWCLDAYHDSYEGAPNDGSAWIENDPFEQHPVDPETIRQAFEQFRDAQPWYQVELNKIQPHEIEDMDAGQGSDPTASAGVVAGTTMPRSAGPRSGITGSRATGDSASDSAPPADEEIGGVPGPDFSQNGSESGAQILSPGTILRVGERIEEAGLENTLSKISESVEAIEGPDPTDPGPGVGAGIATPGSVSPHSEVAGTTGPTTSDSAPPANEQGPDPTPASAGAVAGTTTPGTAGPRTGAAGGRTAGSTTSDSVLSADDVEAIEQGPDPTPASAGAVAGTTTPGTAGPRTGSAGCRASGTTTSASALPADDMEQGPDPTQPESGVAAGAAAPSAAGPHTRAAGIQDTGAAAGAASASALPADDMEQGPDPTFAASGAVAGAAAPGSAGPRSGTGAIPAAGAATSDSAPPADEEIGEVNEGSDPTPSNASSAHLGGPPSDGMTNSQIQGMRVSPEEGTSPLNDIGSLESVEAIDGSDPTQPYSGSKSQHYGEEAGHLDLTGWDPKSTIHVSSQEMNAPESVEDIDCSDPMLRSEGRLLGELTHTDQMAPGVIQATSESVEQVSSDPTTLSEVESGSLAPMAVGPHIEVIGHPQQLSQSNAPSAPGGASRPTGSGVPDLTPFGRRRNPLEPSSEVALPLRGGNTGAGVMGLLQGVEPLIHDELTSRGGPITQETLFQVADELFNAPVCPQALLVSEALLVSDFPHRPLRRLCEERSWSNLGELTGFRASME